MFLDFYSVKRELTDPGRLFAVNVCSLSALVVEMTLGIPFSELVAFVGTLNGGHVGISLLKSLRSGKNRAEHAPR
jgi:hypothetical protein